MRKTYYTRHLLKHNTTVQHFSQQDVIELLDETREFCAAAPLPEHFIQQLKQITITDNFRNNLNEFYTNNINNDFIQSKFLSQITDQFECPPGTEYARNVFAHKFFVCMTARINRQKDARIAPAQSNKITERHMLIITYIAGFAFRKKYSQIYNNKNPPRDSEISQKKINILKAAKLDVGEV